MQLNKLKVAQLYIWIILFFIPSPICSASNSNNVNYINDTIIEDYSIANLGSKLETIEIVKQIEDCCQQNDLIGLSIIITAGPTHEMIDSVSYISSKSSGKMGYAIAEAATKRGARVTLISGPVHIDVPQGVTCFNVVSAEEMYKVAIEQAVNHDIFIGAAGVADYRLDQLRDKKIKKKGKNGRLMLELVECIDVIASVAKLDKNRPFMVGFAAESNNLERYAQEKLIDKNLDLICANDISKTTQGFNSEYNALHLYWRDGDKVLPLTSKCILSHQLLTEIVKHYKDI